MADDPAAPRLLRDDSNPDSTARGLVCHCARLVNFADGRPAGLAVVAFAGAGLVDFARVGVPNAVAAPSAD
jgi:hypothetical protein